MMKEHLFLKGFLHIMSNFNPASFSTYLIGLKCFLLRSACDCSTLMKEFRASTLMPCKLIVNASMGFRLPSDLTYLGMTAAPTWVVTWKWFFFWHTNESSGMEKLKPLSASTLYVMPPGLGIVEKVWSWICNMSNHIHSNNVFNYTPCCSSFWAICEQFHLACTKYKRS